MRPITNKTRGDHRPLQSSPLDSQEIVKPSPHSFRNLHGSCSQIEIVECTRGKFSGSRALRAPRRLAANFSRLAGQHFTPEICTILAAEMTASAKCNKPKASNRAPWPGWVSAGRSVLGQVVVQSAQALDQLGLGGADLPDEMALPTVRFRLMGLNARGWIVRRHS